MKSCLLTCNILHSRDYVKRYRFRSKQFWFAIDFSEWNGALSKLPLISKNRFNLYTFKDSDHLSIDKNLSFEQNVVLYLKQNGCDEKVTNITLFAHLNFLGYVFNPLSMIRIELENGRKCAIIQVGNTFNELKKYFIRPEDFVDESFKVKFPKYFYVSPFIPLNSEFTFCYSAKDDQVNIDVLDHLDEKLVLSAHLRAQKVKLTTLNLIKYTALFPFMTLRVIFMIHYHAFVLWLMRIPYIKKEENPHLQKGASIWKT